MANLLIEENLSVLVTNETLKHWQTFSHIGKDGAMQLGLSSRGVKVLEQFNTFMESAILPAESIYDSQRAELIAEGKLNTVPPVIEDLKVQARSQGLWNLFLPALSDGLGAVDYAYLAERTGWSIEIAPEAINCAAPDTGNMEILSMFGTETQKAEWLAPLTEGKIRSAFAMTEPDVGSSDATNIQLSIRRDGDHYVLNGRKWWATGVMDPRCEFMIVMGKTDLEAPRHLQQSMIVVPVNTRGVTRVRDLSLFGYFDQHGHGEVDFDNVRVPVANLLGEEGSGFSIAQARLGPGRIHHCMRTLGVAERALSMMLERASMREVFGAPLVTQGVIQQWIAESRIEIDQARLLTLKAAWMIENHGAKAARTEIASIKVVAPRAALHVVDRAIQVFGAKGIGPDTPLPRLFAGIRALRFADGPDEVHLRDIARQEIKRAAK
jgi:acyl-CoA dehydrogenase